MPVCFTSLPRPALGLPASSPGPCGRPAFSSSGPHLRDTSGHWSLQATELWERKRKNSPTINFPCWSPFSHLPMCEETEKPGGRKHKQALMLFYYYYLTETSVIREAKNRGRGQQGSKETFGAK